MFKWVHFGVGLNLTGRTLYLINDDDETRVSLKIDYSKIGIGNKLAVRGGGRFVLGQRLYSPEGGFHVLETMDGDFADYRLYNSFLTSSEIADLLKCKNPSLPRQPFVTLTHSSLKKVGDIELGQIELDTVCSDHIPEFYLFFSDKRNFQDALSLCRKIKGEIILPQEPELNEMLYHAFLPQREKCQDIWTHFFWLGFEGDLNNRTWHKLLDRKAPEWFNFLSLYRSVTQEYQCAATVSHDPYKWAACPCGIEACVLCNFTTHPELRLRGMCKVSLLDKNYSFRENDEYKLVFEGVWHTMILFEDDTWVLRSRLYQNISGRMILKTRGEYPVGVHTWELSGDRCADNETDLLLTSCNVTQYTCNDGSCIQKDARCDLSMDCADESDEMDCSVVAVPARYAEKIPPPNVFAEPLPVNISFNITSIKEFDLTSFSIGVDMMITTKWEDRRLKYKNIRGNYKVNQVESIESVWTPKLKYRDGTLSAAKLDVHSENIYVSRLTGALPDDSTTILEDIVYSGKGNPLVFEQELTIDFKCHFRLQMYPFDRQVCFLEFILELTSDLGVLTQVILEFQNLYGYYIGNTFLPTIMLVTIGYTCFLFDLADFEDRIMVSLTLLLVLATFFSQVSLSIPRTAYLKLIDVWFLALITDLFAVIMSLVIVEVIRLKALDSTTVIKVVPLMKEAKSSKFESFISTWFSEPNKLNMAFFYFYPITLIVLLIIFVSVGGKSLFAAIPEEFR
ncbi:uncharacterized protein [Macrobrachium rosenbergii]|uniref:uncharacterized protein isoform X2 n=1 Tax=Macrobrachium rosenbergii TaxID=79674 RepID=UPI0034D4AA50